MVSCIAKRPDPASLRMLEIGAGSGAFAEALRLVMPIARIIGLDNLFEVREAGEHDRPGAGEHRKAISALSPNCVGVASATGWNNHIPVAGFARAFGILEPGEWFIFHVKPNDPDPECAALVRWIEDKIHEGRMSSARRGKLFRRYSVNGERIDYDYMIGRKTTTAGNR